MTAALVLLLWLLPQLVSRVSATDQSIYAEVKHDISSNRSHVGDPVELVVLENWKDKDGAVMIPAKAVLKGKVTAAQKHAGETSGLLSLMFDKAEWDGGSVSLHASIASVVVTELGRHQPTEMVLRGASQGTAATGSPEEVVHMFPKDCAVERPDSRAASAMVCRKRNVVLRKSGRVLVLNHPDASP